MPFAAAWRTFGSLNAKHPSVKTALSALVWLPTAIVFTNYGYTVKSVRGRSMQVRRTTRCTPGSGALSFKTVC
jgi:hypothetical protein